MHQNDLPVFDLGEAPGLRSYVEDVFRFERESAKVVRKGMLYQYAPERMSLSHQGLEFVAILNLGRHDYVKQSLGKLAESMLKKEREPRHGERVEAAGMRPT